MGILGGARTQSGSIPEVQIVSQSSTERPLAGRFPTTHWSRVVAAGDPETPRAREALGALCAAYWFPLYAYVRSRGHSPE
jgi:RNA polymerase sigma-70 factor (ECF subfamily)